MCQVIDPLQTTDLELQHRGSFVQDPTHHPEYQGRKGPKPLLLQSQRIPVSHLRSRRTPTPPRPTKPQPAAPLDGGCTSLWPCLALWAVTHLFTHFGMKGRRLCWASPLEDDPLSEMEGLVLEIRRGAFLPATGRLGNPSSVLTAGTKFVVVTQKPRTNRMLGHGDGGDGSQSLEYTVVRNGKRVEKDVQPPVLIVLHSVPGLMNVKVEQRFG